MGFSSAILQDPTAVTANSMVPQGLRKPAVRASGGIPNDQQTPTIFQPQAENADGPSGTIAGSTMMPQEFIDQTNDARTKALDVLGMGKTAIQGNIDAAERMQKLESQISGEGNTISGMQTDSKYNPSVLRQILGVGLSMLGGKSGGTPYERYRQVADFPRQRAIQGETTKLATMQSLQKLLEGESGAYKSASGDISGIGNAYSGIANNASTMLGMMYKPQLIDQQTPTGPTKSFVNAGLLNTGQPIPGAPSYPQPQKFTYRDTMAPAGPQVTGFPENGGPPVPTGQVPQATNEETMLAQSPEGRKILANPALYAELKRNESYKQEVLAAEMLRHNDQLLAQSYRFNDEQLDKAGGDLTNKFQLIERVRDLLHKGAFDPGLGGKPNQQADTEAAIQLLSLTAGGGAAGGGVALRPNEAILNRIAGGGNKWVGLENELRQWGAPGATASISLTQRKQMMSIIDEVEKVAKEKSGVIDDARSRFATAQKPVDIENIKVDAMKRLHGGTAAPSGGGGRIFANGPGGRIYSDDNGASWINKKTGQKVK